MWYIQIMRSNIPEYNDTEWEDVVVGPFKSKGKAVEHMNYSADIEDWCYGEAKAKQYNVDNVFVTKNPEIPSYGINAPLYTED